MTLDELKSTLWGAAVLLRGKINATGYKEYIFPLVFFKRISDVHEEEVEKLRVALKKSIGDVEQVIKGLINWWRWREWHICGRWQG